jgi:hypothetical protein
MQVVETEMPIDKVKNQRKGFCFITFDNEQIVQQLLKTPKQTICGKKVEMKKAQHPQNPRGMMGAWGGPMGMTTRGYPGGRGAPRGRGGRGGRGDWSWSGYGQGTGGYGSYGQGTVAGLCNNMNTTTASVNSLALFLLLWFSRETVASALLTCRTMVSNSRKRLKPMETGRDSILTSIPPERRRSVMWSSWGMLSIYELKKRF